MGAVDGKLRRSRLFGWWYVSIGAGFFLLGLHYLLAGQPISAVLLRWVIAGGFVALGLAELRIGLGRRK
jgi:hypothetical protein